MTIPGSDPINDLKQVFLGLNKTEGTEGPQYKKVAGQTSNVPGDAVNFSTELKEREAIIQQVQALPDIREAQIQSIREALAQGQTLGNGELVAAGVIKETILNTVA